MGSLALALSLRMVWRSNDMLDVVVDAVGMKESHELGSIIGPYNIWASITAHNVAMKKLCDGLGISIEQGQCLRPFGEAIYSRYDVFVAILGLW